MIKIPKTISTTQLQRKPGLLAEYIEEGKEVLVLKDSEALGVISPVDTYNAMVDRIKQLEEELVLKAVEAAEKEIAEKGIDGLMTMDEFFKKVKQND